MTQPDALNDIHSRWEVIRARVKFVSLSALDNAEIKSIDGREYKDRALHVSIPPPLLDKSYDAVEALDGFVEDFISSVTDTISRREANLLRSAAGEAAQYALIDMPGADVELEVFKSLFRDELEGVLEQIHRIIQEVLDRRTLRGPRIKPYWRQVPLTIGVEEEYQIVSAETFELVQDAERFLGSVEVPKCELDGEVYRSQLELKTGVCESLIELNDVLVNARRSLQDSLPAGLRLLSASTHPFSAWDSQVASDTPRVGMFMHDMQDVVRRLLIFGLHVHVGIEDREMAIRIMESARRFLPPLLGLSSSSPFWEGRATGLMSYRSTVFSVLPRTGLPPMFANGAEFDAYLELLTRTKSFDSVGSFDPTKIWWDIRVHPRYPTLEFRVCDSCSNVRHSVAIAGVFQALVGRLAQLEYQGYSIASEPLHVVEENKWRAARYGRRARYIDSASGTAVGSRYKVLELLDFIDEPLLELGSEHLVREQLMEILQFGSSADTQLALYRATGSLREVVRGMADQFGRTDQVAIRLP